jgi:hypothetical protein
MLRSPLSAAVRSGLQPFGTPDFSHVYQTWLVLGPWGLVWILVVDLTSSPFSSACRGINVRGDRHLEAQSLYVVSYGLGELLSIERSAWIKHNQLSRLGEHS